MRHPNRRWFQMSPRNYKAVFFRGRQIFHFNGVLLNIRYTLFSLFFLLTIFPLASMSNFNFTEAPRNQSVLLGESVVIKCSSNTAPKYKQWRVNDGTVLAFEGPGVLGGFDGRYRYISDADNMLNLRIDDISLSDDGIFECQMALKGTSIRATANVEVIVMPTQLYLYPSGTSTDVEAGVPLNVSCISPTSKPSPAITLFLNGKKIPDVSLFAQRNHNGTFKTTAFATFVPNKNDHGKMLACEVFHESTDKTLREYITLNVRYPSDPPEIKILTSSGSEQKPIKAGENVTLLCLAQGGNPPPTLVWSDQDGVLNSTSETSTYDKSSQTISNIFSFIAKNTDNGNNYVCSSWNYEQSEQLRASLSLDILYPPENVAIIGKPTVRKGDFITLACHSSISNPSSTISWKINDVKFPSQPQTTKQQVHGIVTESNITFDTSVDFDHEPSQIQVECIADNGVGQSVSALHITRILSEFMNLTCEAKGGSPLAQLSWYRGLEKHKHDSNKKHTYHAGQWHHKNRTRWKKIPTTYNSNYRDSARSIISIRVDRTMNGNRFRCEVESPALEVPLNVDAAISVRFPPHRLDIVHIEADYDNDGGQVRQTTNEHNEILTMMANRPAKLSCVSGSSNPASNIHWEIIGKDGEDVDRQTGHYTKRVSKPNGEFGGYRTENVIQFSPNETMNGNLVRCVASSPRWPEVIRSDNNAPRILINGHISLEVREGASFEEKIAIDANPPVDYFQWRKNGAQFERSIGSIFVKGPYPIVIGGVAISKEDAGIYSLKVSNRIGVANISVRLSITYGARVVYITSPIYASIGDNVVLECEADGNPIKPNMVKWMRGDTIAQGSMLQSQKRAILSVNASHENSGAYKCVVDNGIGEANDSTALLLVRHSPRIIDLPSIRRTAGPPGGKAHMFCQVEAVPTAEFSWVIEGEGKLITYNTTKYMFYDSKLDISTFQSTLIVMNLEDSDYKKKFRCRAYNRLGNNYTTFVIEQPTIPDIPLDIKIFNVTQSTAVIMWTIGFDGGFSQTFEIQYWGTDQLVRSFNTTNSRVILRDLNDGEKYSAKVRAINKRFVSQFSEPIEFYVSDDQNFGPLNNDSKSSNNSLLSQPLFYWTFAILAFLFLFNCIVIAYRCLSRRYRMKKKASSNGQPNGRGGIQIYGAMDNAPTDRNRPNSKMTDKSEEFGNSEDNEDNQTIIEVSPPYGQLNNHLGNSYFHNATQLVSEFNPGNGDIYARIQKMPYQDTYYSHHNPIPPEGVDELSCYQDYSTHPMSVHPHSPMYLRNADGGVEYVHMQPQNNGEETGGVMLHPEGQYAHYYYVQDPMNAIPYGHDYPANEYNNNSGIDQGDETLLVDHQGGFVLNTTQEEYNTMDRLPSESKKNFSTFQQPQAQRTPVNEALV